MPLFSSIHAQLAKEFGFSAEIPAVIKAKVEPPKAAKNTGENPNSFLKLHNEMMAKYAPGGKTGTSAFLTGVFSDIQTGINAEIDAFNNLKPTFGSYDEVFESQKGSRTNISALRTQVEQYRGYMDPAAADQILSTLDQLDKGYDSLLELTKNNGVIMRTPEQVQQELEQVNNELEQLRGTYHSPTVARAIVTPSDLDVDVPMLGPEIVDPAAQAIKKDAESFRTLERRRTALQWELKDAAEWYDTSRRLQTILSLESVADPNSENYDPQFAEKSKYKPQEYTPMSNTAIWTDNYEFDGRYPWPDPLYEAINGNKQAQAWLSNKAAAQASDDNPLGRLFYRVADGKYELRQLTEHERQVYNYYANAGDSNAHEYYRLLETDLYARQRLEDARKAAADAKVDPVGSTLFGIIESPMAGLSYLGQIFDYMDDGKIDGNAPYNKFAYTQGDITSAVSSQIEAAGWGKVGSWGYQQAVGLGNFLMATAAGGGNQIAVLAIMSSSAAANETINAKKRGLDDDQAFALGTIAGAAEIISEKIGLDMLFDTALRGKSPLTYMLKNAMGESLEEPTSSLINFAADVIISKDKSQWQQSIQAYRDDGYDENEAFWRAVTDQAASLGLDALGGFFSGSTLGGGSVAIGSISLNTAAKKETAPRPAQNVSATPTQVSEQTLALGTNTAPDPISAAVVAYKQTGTVTNKLAQDILNSSAAMATLREQTGMQLPDTAAGRRSAVKAAVAQLAQQQAEVQNVKSTEIGDAHVNEPVSMEDFANSESPVWRNVEYSDEATKTSIMQSTHNSMVAEGAVVTVSDKVTKSVEQAYPDLRSVKKKERAPILKSAMAKLKNDLRQFLTGFKNQSFEFEVNGKILEAKLYNTGINEVLEKVTQKKANMLYSTKEIFQNARYLYSTPDYDGDPNVYRWNYFYTPVQIGEETVGVRIAVRDVATPQESQIYNWGIKKDASLGGVGRGVNNRISHDASSDAPHASLDGVRDDSNNRKPYCVSSDASVNSIPQTPPSVNPDSNASVGDVSEAWSPGPQPTSREALAWVLENMELQQIDPRTRSLLQQYGKHLQQLQTIERLQSQLQPTSADANTSQPPQRNTAKLEQLYARHEKRLTELEKNPRLQRLAQQTLTDFAPTESKNVENSQNEDVDIIRTYDRIKASGQVITDGSHLQNGKLKPNATYQTGEYDYLYQTDGLGRVCRAIAQKLRLKTPGQRKPHSRKTPGKLQGDEAGHLIADRFGGSRKLDNLVSQAWEVNRIEYARLERTWAEAIESGQEVSLDIQVFYEGESGRPTGFYVVYEIDGTVTKRFIQNDSGGIHNERGV